MGKHFAVVVLKRGKQRVAKSTKKTLPKQSTDYQNVPYMRDHSLEPSTTSERSDDILSKLRTSPTGSLLKYRLSAKGCHVYISPTHLHPWFTDGRGAGAISLQVQASILLMKVLGVTTSATCQMLSVNHKAVEDLANRLTYARQS